MHRLLRNNLPARLALIAALTMALLAVSVTSTLAATGGTGSFHAVTTLNPPPQPCSTYRLYNSHLTFSDGSTVTASSDPNPLSSNFQWGEFADGTHHPQTSATGSTACTDQAGQPEAGFSGTLTRAAGVCKLSGGSYKRGASASATPALDVEYDFPTAGMTAVASGACPSTALTITATIPSVPLPTPITVGPFGFDYVSACDSPIAPTSCVLANGKY
jgi:hypothetical protein